MTRRLYARAMDAKGGRLYGMPGGPVRAVVPHGSVLLVAGDGIFYEPERRWYFPVQHEMSILWAPDRAFGILVQRS